MGRCGGGTAFQASPFCLPAIWTHSHFRSRANGGTRHGHLTIQLKFSWQDKHAAPVSVPLCEHFHGQIRLSSSFPVYLLLSANYLETFSFSKQGYWRRTAGTHPILGLRVKFQVAKQASSTNLCASVRAGPWADEAEQQLPRLAPSACQLSADIRIVRTGLLEAPGRDLLRYV